MTKWLAWGHRPRISRILGNQDFDEFLWTGVSAGLSADTCRCICECNIIDDNDPEKNELVLSSFNN